MGNDDWWFVNMMLCFWTFASLTYNVGKCAFGNCIYTHRTKIVLMAWTVFAGLESQIIISSTKRYILRDIFMTGFEEPQL